LNHQRIRERTLQSEMAIAETLMSPDGENLVFLLGAPRSGTSWLAKIFDSHPRVLYRHEPDTVLRNERIPFICSDDDVAKYRDEAQRYLSQLMNVRTLKSAGSLPLFPKTYYGALTRRLHAGLVYSLHAADAISGTAKWARRVPIPDLIGHAPSARPIIIFKSVGSRGRTRVFAEALPKSRIIFILRHPCGQVASKLHGISSGKFECAIAFGAVLRTEEGRTLGLTAERFAAASPIEQCAWHWAILNQKALNDLSGLGEDRVKVVRYEDACANPEQIAKELFAFSELDWNSQTASFVQESTTGPETNEYYRLTRNSLSAANRWRESLSAQDQEIILNIAARVPVGELFAPAR
jgi:hypothetical protein